MSKRSLFWGQASGKLGEAVYYRSGGEQRTRTYVGKIKNPKTYAQMANRLPMANLVAVYRALRPWLKGAYENKPARRSDFNEFFALNKNRLSYVQTKNDAALGLFVPNGMKLSRGTISIFPSITFEEGTGNSATPIVQGLLANPVSTLELTGIGEDTPMNGERMYEIMTAFGNPMQLPSRFKVTMIVFAYGTELPDGADGEAWTSGVYQFDCYQGSSQDVYPVGRLAPYLNSVVPYGTFSDGSGTIRGFRPTFTEPLSGVQMACIVSYTQDGKQYVTSAEVVPSDDAIRLAQPFKRGGDVWLAALNEYGYNPDTALSTAENLSVPSSNEPEEPAPDEEEPAPGD